MILCLMWAFLDTNKDMIYDGMVMMHFYVGDCHIRPRVCWVMLGVRCGRDGHGKCPLDQHLTHGYALVKSMVCSRSWMTYQ